MSSPLPAKRLYIKGLGKDVTTDELSKCLSRYGEVREVKIVHNYAFVEYVSEIHAQMVYDVYRTEPLMGRRVLIQYARPLRKDIAAFRSREMAENQSPHRASPRDGLSRHPVVVLGLSSEVRWQELKDFGRSTGCLVAYCDLDRSDPDTGFLEYFTKEDAEYAVHSLDGKHLGGNVVRVLNYHDYGDERKQRRSRPRSPCRPINPSPNSNVPSTGAGQAASMQPWDYYAPSSNPWGGYNQREGLRGKHYLPVAVEPYHPSHPRPPPALTYSPQPATFGAERYQNIDAPLALRASFTGSCYSSDESPDTHYNPKAVPFYQQGDFDPSPFRYDVVRGGSFSDNYHH